MVALLLFSIAAAAALLTALLLIARLRSTDETPQALDRLIEVTRTDGERPGEERWPAKAEAVLARTSAWLRAHGGLSDTPALRQRLTLAGLKGAVPADLYLAARIFGPLACLTFGWFLGLLVPQQRIFWMLAPAAAAYLLPDLYLSYRVSVRRSSIRRGIPDVVDLLVICVDAGLGLDQAMMRVSQELANSHAEINEEFVTINREQRAGRPRAEAWQAMAARVQLPEIDSMVNMLIQTERFGTPISVALTSFATAVRTRRRQAAEELAAKTTIKIIFPLVFCIFPAIFVVLLGPAALSVYRLMASRH